jgi:hypothetical protein
LLGAFLIIDSLIDTVIGFTTSGIRSVNMSKVTFVGKAFLKADSAWDALHQVFSGIPSSDEEESCLVQLNKTGIRKREYQFYTLVGKKNESSSLRLAVATLVI